MKNAGIYVRYQPSDKHKRVIQYRHKKKILLHLQKQIISKYMMFMQMRV